MTTAAMVIQGTEHWLSSDGIRTFIGPVRHRRSGEVLRARGRMHRKAAAVGTQTDAEATTQVIPAVGTPNAWATLQRAMGVVTRPTPPPPQGWRRVLAWLLGLWYAIVGRATDDEWHRTARNIAGTLLLWSFTVFAIGVFAKGLFWVWTL